MYLLTLDKDCILSKTELISECLCKYVKLIERQVVVKFPGYEEVRLHSYTSNWKYNDAYLDAIFNVKHKIQSGEYWPRISLYKLVNPNYPF